MSAVSNSEEQQLPDIPVFICYRRIDAEWHAEWLYRNLNGRELFGQTGARSRLKVYYDLAAPAVDDWTRIHFPNLERAKALIVICTPGIAKDLSKAKKPDWVYKELGWWCNHRSIAPIIVEAVSDAERWIPDMIQNRWPNINRISLPREEIEEASAQDAEQIVNRISNRILDGIRESQHAVVFEDLEHLKRLNRRLRTAVALGVLALVAALAFLNAFRNKAEEATRASTQAIEKEKEARTNAEVAVELANTARKYVGLSLVGTATGALERDPGSAFAYAFAASSFSPSAESVNLIRRAILGLPVWRRIVPPNTWEDQLFFLPPGPGASDTIAVDPKLRVLLCSANVREDLREAGKTPLYLFDLETGKMVAERTMGSGEELITPVPLATHIFATRVTGKGGKVMLHLLSKDRWIETVHTIESAREVKTSGGDWPCYALTTDGTVLRSLPDPTTGQIGQTKVGSWEAAKQIAVHPSGKAVILLGDDSLKWLNISTGELREVQLSQQDRMSKHRPLHARFANGLEQFFVLSEAAEGGAKERSRSLVAIDLSVGTQRIIHVTKVSPLDSLISDDVSRGFEATPEGSRVVVKERDAAGDGERIKIVDLKWPTGGSKEIQVTSSNYLDQGKDAASVREIQTASLAPNGKFLILASETHGTSGTTTTGGAIESWDLTPLGENTTLRPGPAEFRGIGAPVVRLAYSSDSTRLLAWDARGISHVFRVRTSAPPIFQQQVRIPEEYETRFWKPDVASSERGRFVSARFAPDDLRYFDLQSGLEHDLAKFSHERPILDTVWHSPPSDQFTVATDKSLFAVADGFEKVRVNFSSPADLAWVGREVTAIALKTEIEVYRSKECSLVSKIPIAEAPFWIWADAPDQNSILIYAMIKSKFHAWELRSTGLGTAMRLEAKPAIDVSAEEGTRFSWRVIRDRLVVMKLSKAKCSLQFFDLSSGKETDEYKSPPGGWPADLVSVSNLHVTNDRQMLLFFQSRSGQFYGRWDASGACSDWRKIPSGRIDWINSTDDKSVGSAVLIDEKFARLISLADGSVKAEFQMAFGNRMPSPLVMEGNGGATFSSTEQYQSVVRRILLGGLVEPLPITNVGLPGKLTSELEQLSKSFDQVVRDTRSVTP